MAREPGGPEVLVHVERPDPVPRDHEVVIDVVASSINNTDLNQRSGRSGRPQGEVLGLEASGTIRAVGAQVTGWAQGDRVCALLVNGGYAEQVAVPAHQLIPVPDNVDLVAAGGLAEVFLTAYDGLQLRTKLSAGETVLVHGGAGGLGTAAIQLASAIGARVITTVRREHQVQACQHLGAEVVLTGGERSWDKQVRDLVGDLGVDVILDILGQDAWQQNLDLLAADGRMVVLGTLTGPEVSLDLKQLMRPRRTLFGATLRGRSDEQKAAVVAGFRATWGSAFTDGTLSPVVDRVVPFDDVVAAHESMERGGQVGKLILQMKPEPRV